MKGPSGIFIFFMIFLSVVVSLDAKQTMLYEMCLQEQRYDAILESAVDDAADCLVDIDKGNFPVLKKEEALWVLLHSLYAGFDILEDKQAQKELNGYLPIVMVMDQDGLYVWENVKERWSEKFPYSYEYKYGINSDKTAGIQFTMGEVSYVMTEEMKMPMCATRSDIYKEKEELALFAKKESFEEIKGEAITNTIMEKMTQHLKEANRIGKRYGMEYSCVIPYVEDGRFARTIQNISMLVVFQGYPYGNHITERYNRIETAGARVYKAREE